MTGSTIVTYHKKNTNILRINLEKDVIVLNPDYQRRGDIWPLDKRQLLIDSILNDYDLPKLYFHVLDPKLKKSRGMEYAIIDGRQRLETIWGFIAGDFGLADDFVYFKDRSVKASNMTYADLATEYPKLKTIFDSFDLPIVCVETDDLEIIDDMFLRLNDGVQLNAAEKRTAIGGAMVKAINQTAEHELFNSKVKFSNKRYQYREVAARLLFIVYSLESERKIYDTKKIFLDNFARSFKKAALAKKAKPIEKKVSAVLDVMSKVFIREDPLLRSQAMIPIYFLVFKKAIELKKMRNVKRNRLIEFRDQLDVNRELAEKDISKANFDLIEFDKMSLQGTNDAGSINERTRILSSYLGLL